MSLVALATLAGASLAFGVASALIPLFNAEVYMLSVAVTAPLTGIVAGVAGLAVGQTIGKLAWFYAGRGGSAKLASLVRRRRANRPMPIEGSGRWTRWLRYLARRPTAALLVAVSAATGIPPLAVVSVAAGASPLRPQEFVALCLSGRCVRFAAVALPAFWAAS
jgi:membrane protein YqaA with SNARE-associated domain